jgi:hypothetical protein
MWSMQVRPGELHLRMLHLDTNINTLIPSAHDPTTEIAIFPDR